MTEDAKMTEDTKRKEPEPEEAPKPAAAAESSEAAPKVAVAVKSASEPDAKRLKPNPPEPAVVKKQVEYYLSDENLKYDKFFHEKISSESEGWLEMSLVLSCNKMKALRATKEDVLAALKDSKIEVKDGGDSIRRPGNAPLPKLESKPQHQKKNVAHAHDGGVIAVIKAIPEEQSWQQIKEKIRGKLPEKVQLWFVSEVSEKNTCIIAAAPFEGDLQLFEQMEIEVGGVKLKTEVAQGDLLQQSLKVLPKHIRDKREKEARKRQKERNRPIVVGGLRFVNVTALRTRVKEILNSRSDGEQLKTDGTDYKLIKSLLEFHPKGSEKSKGMVGIKVAKSSQGDTRCFWMVKDDGKEEDFSAQKCLSAVEANPPYVEDSSSKKKEASSPAAAKTEGEAAKTEEAPKESEKKEDEKPAEEAPKEETATA